MPTETPAQIESRIRRLGGVRVVLGSQESWALLDYPEMTVLDEGGAGGVVAMAPAIQVAAGIFNTVEDLVEDAELGVDGVIRRVRGQPMAIDDGRLIRVELSQEQ